MLTGRIVEIEHPIQHYRTVFDQRSGFFVRKEDAGWPEPIWSADGPELIDLSITSYCQRKCSFCYRDANDEKYIHLSIDDIKNVITQAKACGTLQIALGGGNPNQHPKFIEILRFIRESGIVPSYTTNGDGITNEVLKASADYCGAIAVSIYPPIDEVYLSSLLKRINSYGVKVNLHAIICNEYLELWTKWLRDTPTFMKNINAIIFLNYKPMGRTGDALLPKDLDKVECFFRAANDCRNVKVGFDSCSISGIAKWMDVPKVLVESCEAARFSAFISEDMKMYPCSFMTDKGWYGDLREKSLLDIWQNNEYFQRYRNEVSTEKCKDCSLYDLCKGGCHLYPSINFC